MRELHHRLHLRPAVAWDWGQALRWLRQHLDAYQVMPVYAGDDLTGEGALDAVEKTGIGTAVRHAADGDRYSTAQDAVDSPQRLRALFDRLTDLREARR